MTAKLTTESFIEQANLVHNNKYYYHLVQYKKPSIKIKIICSIHGIFLQSAKEHLNGSGCPVCLSIKTIENNTPIFIERANIVHNNKYDYSETAYTHSKTKIKIVCPIHGEFTQSPNSHLSGAGCPHCASEASGFSRTKFKDKCIKNNNGLGILYVIGCWSDDKSEVFIKIGITSRSIKARYQSTRAMPYNYKIIHEITGSPEYIYDLETKLHKKSKHYSYLPNIPFGGSSTECFIADKTYLNNLNSYISSLIPF
jgi:hypothetical protein